MTNYMLGYKLLKHHTAEGLEVKVNDLMRENWDVYGTPMMYPTGATSREFVQAMVKQHRVVTKEKNKDMKVNKPM